MYGRRQKEIPEHPVIKDMERFGYVRMAHAAVAGERILRLAALAQDDRESRGGWR